MITGVTGEMGQGKGICMTYLAMQEHFALGRKVMSNYHLRGIPFRYITFEDFMGMAEREDDLRDTAIFIQEAHVWFDSRQSASKLNRMGSYIVNQTNKLSTNLYWDSQNARQVDLRLRQRTDISIVVYKQKSNMHLCVMRNENRPWQKAKKFVIYGPDVWPYYDTKEAARVPITKR